MIVRDSGFAGVFFRKPGIRDLRGMKPVVAKEAACLNELDPGGSSGHCPNTEWVLLGQGE